jgi:hypothetical protein
MNKQVPPWYHGERLRGSLAQKIPIIDLSGHVLDEIIDNILNNSDTFQWEGPYGLADCLNVNQRGLKDRLWTWNSQKIRFAKISLDTPDKKDLELAIFKIARGYHAERCWQRYRTFVASEGCPLPVEPAVLFKRLYPKTIFKSEIDSELSSWKEFRGVVASRIASASGGSGGGGIGTGSQHCSAAPTAFAAASVSTDSAASAASSVAAAAAAASAAAAAASTTAGGGGGSDEGGEQVGAPAPAEEKAEADVMASSPSETAAASAAAAADPAASAGSSSASAGPAAAIRCSKTGLRGPG